MYLLTVKTDVYGNGIACDYRYRKIHGILHQREMKGAGLSDLDAGLKKFV